MLRVAEGGVDLGDLGGEEGAAVETDKRLQIRIFSEQRTEFLPGILRLDVWEIAGRELSATQTLRFVFIHFFHATKLRNFRDIAKEKRKYFGIISNNVV